MILMLNGDPPLRNGFERSGGWRLRLPRCVNGQHLALGESWRPSPAGMPAAPQPHGEWLSRISINQISHNPDPFGRLRVYLGQFHARAHIAIVTRCINYDVRIADFTG